MSTPVIIELQVEEPILLELSVSPPVYINPSEVPATEPLFTSSEAALLRSGDKARIDNSVQFSEGDRYSSVHAGTVGEASFTDDYLYVCVKTGTAGNAIWKKSPLFISQ